MLPTIFICFLIGVAWFTYERKKATRLSEKATDEFWQREVEANHTRNQDISDIELVSVSETDIPTYSGEDDNIIASLKQVMSILPLPMADLSELSNTDLKLRYGVGNFATVTSYDTNYINFVCALSILAKHFSNNLLWKEAQQTYDLMFRLGTYTPEACTGYGNACLSLDEPEKVTALINSIHEKDLPRQERLIEALRKSLASYV